jgi:hypothetical protein
MKTATEKGVDRMTEAFVAKVPSEPFVSAERAFDTTYSPSGENACPHKLSSRSEVLTKNFSSMFILLFLFVLSAFLRLGKKCGRESFSHRIVHAGIIRDVKHGERGVEIPCSWSARYYRGREVSRSSGNLQTGGGYQRG